MSKAEKSTLDFDQVREKLGDELAKELAINIMPNLEKPFYHTVDYDKPENRKDDPNRVHRGTVIAFCHALLGNRKKRSKNNGKITTSTIGESANITFTKKEYEITNPKTKLSELSNDVYEALEEEHVYLYHIGELALHGGTFRRVGVRDGKEICIRVIPSDKKREDFIEIGMKLRQLQA